MFFSRVNFVYWLLFGIRSTPVLLQRHVKDPGHSSNSAGGRSQSSQLAEPLWTDHSLKSVISARELISTLKKKVQAGNELLNILLKQQKWEQKEKKNAETDRVN